MTSVYERAETEARMFDPDPYWTEASAADVFDPPPQGLDARDWLTWLDHVPEDRFHDALTMVIEDYSHVLSGIISFAVGLLHVDRVIDRKPVPPISAEEPF